MIAKRIKNFLPRSLYGRATLILLVPVLVVQIVVTIVFVQRNFEGVTRQMVSSVALDVNFLLNEVAENSSLKPIQNAQERLQLNVRPMSDMADNGNQRNWWDVSGITVISALNVYVPNVQWVDLKTSTKVVTFAVRSPIGPLIVGVPRDRVSVSNPHQLLVLMIFVGIFTTLISFAFLRNQLRPIRRMARAAEAFGKGQVVDYHPTGAIEVRAAGNAFLDMRNRIERQIEQRTLMLSGVSHDLRTPLTRLRLALSMSDDTEAGAMVRDVEDMERLLDTFLDYARGDALEKTSAINPNDLAKTAVENAQKLQQVVSLSEASKEQLVDLRPIAVARALGNLIGNAARFADEISLSVSLSERSLTYIVEDNGPGIPKNDRETAMRPFIRLDEARNQNKGPGVGLGLSIVADIARTHGGVLLLSDSETLGGLKAELVIARRRDE